MTCHVVPSTVEPCSNAPWRLGVVVPVLADDRVLILQQSDGGVELLLVQRVGIIDAEIGLRRLEVQRRVGDVDRRVVRGDLALVRRSLVEHDAPRVGRRGDDVVAPHQVVGAPSVRNAVVLPVTGVVVLILEERREVGVVLDQGGVDRRDEPGIDEANAGVARGRHAVVSTGAHQLEHLVGGRRDLRLDDAAGLVLERVHPVVRRVGAAVFGIARPHDQVEGLLARRRSTSARRRQTTCCRHRKPTRAASLPPERRDTVLSS